MSIFKRGSLQVVDVNDNCNCNGCAGRYVLKFDRHYRLFKLVCDKCGFVEKYMSMEKANGRSNSGKVQG